MKRNITSDPHVLKRLQEDTKNNFMLIYMFDNLYEMQKLLKNHNFQKLTQAKIENISMCQRN